MRMDRKAGGLALLVAVSAIAGHLENRRPAWLEQDPILQPFGIEAAPDPVGVLDSILFPRAPAPAAPRVIDPNMASRDEWIALPGIGPATADRIAEWLSAGRRFRQAEDLGQVRGIGPVRIEQLRPWLEFPSAPVDSSSYPADSR
jgi:hypothetical protein